jgi:hypothetical protein
MAEDVKRAGREPGRLAERAEPRREPLRVDRATEPVGEHKVGVYVGVPGEVAFELLDVAVLAEDARRLGVERDRATRARTAWLPTRRAACFSHSPLLHRGW